MCQNAHSVVVVFPNGATINPQCESVKAVGLVEVPDLLEKETSLNSETNLLNRTYQMLDRVDNYAPCNLNVDIEKGMPEIPKSSEESIGCLKSDDSLSTVLQKVIWLQLTGIFMNLFVQQSHDLPMVSSKDRYLAERVYDTPTNRSRKFKRSPSFNSRRVVLLFSVVSSMGTIILIYLTLRVRQISDGSGTI
ncbi:uncharacterized protein LOC131001435 isoform X2 [Salvia miltiorrhiza]|uniref:uncharacterized protein LOC131001435 isoform X2 n=1 Tax=Salvia miltiorrhiza TaxID=226208 RepID=UPI0025AD0909|nr:uncharacterized protein LOC131001435 isoform X2 [Salvia miltiorrhiza]